jgi:hypothetical protein
MEKNSIAQMATVVVLLGALGVALIRKTGLHPLEAQARQDPQDTITATLAAARAGDVKTYLSEFAGPMEASLRQALVETTEPAFADYLKGSNAAIKGVAISEPEGISSGEVKVRVEYVYQDRDEAQTMYLEKRPGGWKISRTDGDQRVKTLIPYGTPVK